MATVLKGKAYEKRFVELLLHEDWAADTDYEDADFKVEVINKPWAPLLRQLQAGQEDDVRSEAPTVPVSGLFSEEEKE